MVDRYALTTPCKKCPFRKDVESYLAPERVESIARSLREGEDFTCHKTIDYGEDDEGNATADVNRRGMVCAGALSICESEGIQSQNTRIAERLGLFDPSKLDPKSEVYSSLAEWVADKNGVPTAIDEDGTVYEFEHCEVVTQDCVDPAGYATSAGSARNSDAPTCNPLTDGCPDCGSLVCAACRADDGSKRCRYCAEADED